MYINDFVKQVLGEREWGWEPLAMVNPRGGVACGACGRWWIACHDRWLYRRAGIHSTVLSLTCPNILHIIQRKCLFIFYVVHLLTSWFMFYLACQANKRRSTDLGCFLVFATYQRDTGQDTEPWIIISKREVNSCTVQRGRERFEM